MKRTIAILLALTTVLPLFACGVKEEAAVAEATVEEAPDTSIFAIVPVVFLFMSIKKNLTSGLAAGGVKG